MSVDEAAAAAAANVAEEAAEGLGEWIGPLVLLVVYVIPFFYFGHVRAHIYSLCLLEHVCARFFFWGGGVDGREVLIVDCWMLGNCCSNLTSWTGGP